MTVIMTAFPKNNRFFISYCLLLGWIGWSGLAFEQAHSGRTRRKLTDRSLFVDFSLKTKLDRMPIIAVECFDLQRSFIILDGIPNTLYFSCRYIDWLGSLGSQKPKGGTTVRIRIFTAMYFTVIVGPAFAQDV